MTRNSTNQSLLLMCFKKKNIWKLILLFCKKLESLFPQLLGKSSQGFWEAQYYIERFIFLEQMKAPFFFFKPVAC